MIITFQEIVQNCLRNHFNFNHTAYIRGSRGSKPPSSEISNVSNADRSSKFTQNYPSATPPPPPENFLDPRMV